MNKLILDTMKQIQAQDTYTIWNIADLFFGPHDHRELNIFDIEAYLFDSLDDNTTELFLDNIQYINDAIEDCKIVTL